VEEAELIRQVLSGKHEQYNVLVERYQEPLIHFLRGILKNESEVFDCAQEAFISAYRNLWRYSDKYSFRSWIYTIARNKAIDLMRKQRHEVPLMTEENLAAQQVGPEEEWISKEETLSVRDALNDLPEHYRQALYLRYHQDLSYEEIAQVLDVPVSRVKTYLHRGKAKLKEQLERRADNDGRKQPSKTVISGSTH